MKGKQIELKSFDIIEKNVDLDMFSSKEAVVVKRIIHSTGDFEFANLVKFSNGALDFGISAIKKKWAVVCDVNMVKVGITERFAKECDIGLHCFINDSRVLDYAKRKKQTRSESAIELANELFDNIIFVIGNAPTALLKIIELYNKRALNNSFVIAFPVGFVDASYSKELLLKTNLPYITNIGTKGGSPAAASAIRALMKIACKDR